MVSLANLAKYQGRYDKFLLLRQRYHLKWSSGNNSIQAMQRFFNPELSIEKLLEKIREMIRVLLAPMGTVLRHACLTGLRPSEAVESARLIINSGGGDMPRYYNPEHQSLEHFLFPDVFLRTTKKAFISFITLDNLQPITLLGPKTPGYNAIRFACKRRRINMDMRYCRKLFASWLRKEGIAPEIVDLLQGRVSQSILTRHYLALSQNMKDDVLKALEKLQMQLQ